MLGRAGAAVSSYRRAIELDPDNVNACLNLGATLLRSNFAADAERAYRESVRLRTDSANAWTGLGCALEMKREFEPAIAAFERALALDPKHEGAGSRLAQLLRERGAARRALEVIEGALVANPASILCLRTKADLCGGVGEHPQALATYRQIISIAGGDLGAYSNLLWTLNFLTDVDAKSILEEHIRFGALLGRSVPRMTPQRPRQSGRRLKIGYVSADFRRHSVSCFIEPLLRHHDRTSVEVHCFYDYAERDDVTIRINELAEHWHEIAGFTDEDLARLILDNQIDILVDLAGHTAHNRMRVFAAKPAPLQFTWLGYLCTTGLATMDYRLCDVHTDPPEIAERWQVEVPARLPDSQWCYKQQVVLPDISPLPIQRNGFWTFGSFNQESKLNTTTLDAWAHALAAIPNSRLRIVGVTCDIVEERIRQCFAATGISADRVELVGRIPIDAYFTSYRHVDIALDSFPYNGATTTCDALIMGVPVATVAGERAIARGGVSLLSTLGLSDWIAPSIAALPEMLRKQTENPERLAALRGSLRERMRASALMDGARFARNVEAAFRSALSFSAPSS
jgi:predicted O-linked N-acetylglucosamine transferase (SPINDLY family)